jgi:hypothetical protein
MFPNLDEICEELKKEIESLKMQLAHSEKLAVLAAVRYHDLDQCKFSYSSNLFHFFFYFQL